MRFVIQHFKLIVRFSAYNSRETISIFQRGVMCCWCWLFHKSIRSVCVIFCHQASGERAIPAIPQRIHYARKPGLARKYYTTIYSLIITLLLRCFMFIDFIFGPMIYNRPLQMFIKCYFSIILHSLFKQFSNFARLEP